ncbi:MAG: peptidoglycan-associated lipoprotein Pal [Nitrospirae bacterium]|nr:peptidoglycan-associated lipoprotein Pal [Candidatus Manganitrophaceae bacterium]
MKKGSFLFVLVGVGLVFLQGGCAKKITPVSGTATLSDERSAGSLPPPGVNEEKIHEERVQTDHPSSIQENRNEQMAAASEKSDDLLDVFFEYDQAILKEESKANLQKNAKRLTEGRVKIRIEGHADERGTEEYNLTLGERRAQAVKRFLTALGIDKSRIQTISYGEERPFCNQHEENCYKQNRRAHFVVTP